MHSCELGLQALNLLRVEGLTWSIFYRKSKILRYLIQLSMFSQKDDLR